MRLIEGFRKLDKKQRVELIAASVLTVAFLIALPVYAWFANNKNLETITKIKEPGEIIIRAGKTSNVADDDADPIVNFEMKDIDIEEIQSGIKKRVVFSVNAGDYSSIGYKIQLAHTTNIPFTYTLYKANKVILDPSTATLSATERKQYLNSHNMAEYSKIDDPLNVVYYQIDGDAIGMTPLNLGNNKATYGRNIAKQDDTDDAYKCYSQTYNDGDTPDPYAVPIYLQTDEALKHDNEDTSGEKFDYFILELGWDNSADADNETYGKWNKAENNKETDMIYITAKRFTG